MKERNSYKFDGIDFTGQRFGRLLVVEKAQKGRAWWICKCDCGNTVTIRTCKLFTNKSCGCLEKENRQKIADRTRKHGMTNTILYSKWCGMKSRCLTPTDKHYPLYGGRGITICKEWVESFEIFKNWAYSNGYDDNKKGYEQTLDRIDVNGNYCPENCRWVDQKTQSNNKRNTIHFDFNNKTYCVSEFSCEYNIPNYFVRRRFRKGDSPQEIIDFWKSKERIKK